LIDRNDKENNLGVTRWFNRYSIPVRSIDWNTWPIETRKTKFLAKFLGNYFECLKRFQALWMALWNILTLHTFFLMKY